MLLPHTPTVALSVPLSVTDHTLLNFGFITGPYSVENFRFRDRFRFGCFHNKTTVLECATCSSLLQVVTMWLLFTCNGALELAAAAVMVMKPEMLWLAAPLDDTGRFLFTAFAFSIAAFGVMTLSAAAAPPRQTRSITLGAMLYHAAFASTAASYVASGVLLPMWYGAAAVHAVLAVGFAHHYATRVVIAKRRAKPELDSAVEASQRPDYSSFQLDPSAAARPRSYSREDMRHPDSARLEEHQWSSSTDQ